MTAYDQAKARLSRTRHRWCVTGVAGFIGSNLLQTLLELGQEVVGLDNFATGFRSNLEQVRTAVGEQAWERFEFVEGDIRRPADCARACSAADFVLHQAALGSVPRSIADPATTHEANVDGFVNMLIAARDAGMKRFVYASSSSVYGDHPGLPKVEAKTGEPLSPYAVTKCVNEMYAAVFARTYGMATVGLRYFNVFGPRQDPHGAYAAVIPRWAAALIEGRPVEIFGDGETSRDFCYVDNAVQANVLAALAENEAALNEVYNVAVGERTTLKELHSLQSELLTAHYPDLPQREPTFAAFRAGDVRHSHADISKAQRLLGYAPSHRIREGLACALAWYVANLGTPAALRTGEG